MPSPIRIAVVGAGAFGRNHLRVLHELEHQRLTASSQSEAQPHTPSRAATALGTSQSTTLTTPTVQLAAGVDLNPAIRAEVAHRYSIPTFATVDDLLAANLDLHAATVAVPTVHHAQVATQLLQANLDVLVEKPLTATLAEADALITLAQTRSRILAAGHLERFNPSVTAALARLTRPMFFEAHRLSIFTPRSLDVDVVLDLMIHDLDILLTMAQHPAGSEAGHTSPVTEVRAVGLPVLSPKVDIANVRLEFRSGAIANLTASRVSTEQVRKLRLFQPAQYLSLDYARQELLTINVDSTLGASAPAPSPQPKAPPIQSPQPEALPLQSPRPEAPPLLSSRPEAEGRSGETPATSSAGPADASRQPHPSAGLTFEKHALPRVEPLRLELEDFLHAVHTRTPPRVTARAARDALALALDINNAIAVHARQTGLS